MRKRLRRPYVSESTQKAIFRGGKPVERFGTMLRVDELEKALTK